MTPQAIVGLVPAPGRVRVRRLTLYHPGTPEAAIDLSALDPDSEQMRRVRGGHMGMVFQDAAASLSPVRTVDGQLREAIRLHRPTSRGRAADVAAKLLDRVGVPEPRRRLRSLTDIGCDVTSTACSRRESPGSVLPSRMCWTFR